ncbi:response regulator [Chondromyces apiculatus]|uniref:Phosphate regulon transcriptional regulatory protein PhoB (SphR) n=1 Tax=Chondromyces apiculatus DSM 436 TaxID=1192034 RepID=A0A017T5Y3_9BACT|nr:response regulator [Chondromyces apiculatus]EYF04609.1 Phosphate regulon transcriptional regulatory protein PhoB (SphR) [Chondromyces apiculatus DSM 436]
MARILVIEDEPALLKVLDYNLRQAGHEVLATGHGEEGIRKARETPPDLVLLDMMLPDMPGTEVCRALQRSDATRRIPVIIVSARGDEVDRVVGFELGAVDYVVKPFSVRELLLRIQAVLRRSRVAAPTARCIEFGCLRMDEEAHRVWVDDQEVELTLLELKLLLALHESRDRVQSRSALLEGVWGADVNVTTRTVDTHVKRLRDKLGRAGDYIETVRGIGYRFAGSPDLDPSRPRAVREA